MRHLVFCTLVATGLANIGAQGANCFAVLAAARHRCRSQCADLSAIDVQCDAMRHHLDVGLMQTRSCTVITGYCARIACFYAGVEFLGVHLTFSWISNRPNEYLFDLVGIANGML
jgi:hypothetical protein